MAYLTPSRLYTTKDDKLKGFSIARDTFIYCGEATLSYDPYDLEIFQLWHHFLLSRDYAPLRLFLAAVTFTIACVVVAIADTIILLFCTLVTHFISK